MSFKRRVLNAFIGFIKKIFKIFGAMGNKLASLLAEELIPIIAIKTKYGPISFYCFGELSLWRAQNLLIREPETIEWIDSFNVDSVFWDIGANVGVFSLYANLRHGIDVLAFEPAAANYYALNKNIEINKAEKKIMAYCLAFNNVSQLDYFHMGDTNTGSALHSFAKEIDWRGEGFTPKFSQGMVGFSVDDFIAKFDPRFPTHIKIDVDGIEREIIEGCQQTLKDIRLKSILVELNKNMPDEGVVITLIEQAGLKYLYKKQSYGCESSKFAPVYNYFFSRQ